MPKRQVILANQEIYHVYNRSLRKTHIFSSKKEFDFFTEAFTFYINPAPPVKFSVYRKKRSYFDISHKAELVTICAYTIMPTHFHFLLMQNITDGIRKFLHRICNSYSHYYNIRHEQKGPVFESKFKAKHIKTSEQFIHVSRYIHLNPVTDFLVEDPSEYEFSSYSEYILQRKGIVDQSKVMSEFSSVDDYKKFVLDQKDYQRKLDYIKHLI